MFLFEYIKVNKKGGALSEIGGWSHSSYTTAELLLEISIEVSRGRLETHQRSSRLD